MKNVNFVGMTKTIFFFISFILCALFTCCSPTENNPIKPTVIARDDDTLTIGSYTYLYVQDSTLGDGLRLTFIWEENPNNPERLNISEFAPKQRVEFTEIGLYKFSVQLYNGYEFSNIDSVYIYATERSNPIFLDPHLELAVRTTLSIPTEELTIENLLSLTSLYITNLNSVEGIGNLPNLETLSLGINMAGHYLSDISPILDLQKLKVLYLRQLYSVENISILSNIPLLNELHIFYLESTDLSSISNLTNLIKLTIEGCGLQNTEIVGDCLLLTELNLGWNEIENIDELEFMENLTKLILTFNQISNIKPLVDNQFLKPGTEIYIGYNPLDSVSVNEYIPALEARGIEIFNY